MSLFFSDDIVDFASDSVQKFSNFSLVVRIIGSFARIGQKFTQAITYVVQCIRIVVWPRSAGRFRLLPRRFMMSFGRSHAPELHPEDPGCCLNDPPGSPDGLDGCPVNQ